MKTKQLYCSFSLLLIFLLAGCSRALPPHAQGILYCAEGNPESFNPQLVTSGTTLDMTSSQLYDRLLEYDEGTKEFKPALATRWRVSQDGLTYRFFLREDVTLFYHKLLYFTATTAPFKNAQDVGPFPPWTRWLDSNHPLSPSEWRAIPVFYCH